MGDIIIDMDTAVTVGNESIVAVDQFISIFNDIEVGADLSSAVFNELSQNSDAQLIIDNTVLTNFDAHQVVGAPLDIDTDSFVRIGKGVKTFLDTAIASTGFMHLDSDVRLSITHMADQVQATHQTIYNVLISEAHEIQT